MPTVRNLSFRYPHGPDTVAALLRDPEFLEARCASFGERNIEVSVTQEAGGYRVIVGRDLSSDLPAFAKKLFKSENRIVDNTLWRREGDRWVADYTVEIKGTPGRVAGKSQLVPDGDGCLYESRFEVTAKVPIVGAKLESFVADRVQAGMESGVRVNAERLSESAPARA